MIRLRDLGVRIDGMLTFMTLCHLSLFSLQLVINKKKTLLVISEQSAWLIITSHNIDRAYDLPLVIQNVLEDVWLYA